MGHWFGYFLVMLAAALFGGSSVLIKYTYSTGLAPIPVLIMQNSLGALLTWLWVLCSRERAGFSRELLPWMVAQGIFGALTSILFYTVLEPLGAALATLLLFTFPAFVAIYNSVFRKQPMSLPAKLALLLALFGILLCVNITDLRVNHAAAAAVGLALTAAVTNAMISINGERLLAVCVTPVVTAWSLTFSTTLMFLIYRPLWLVDISLSGYQAGLVVAGALLFNFPLMIYLAGLKKIGSGNASIVSTAEIPFTLLLAWLFLHETLGLLQLLGGALIMGSVIILYRQRQV